jgi:hypothetical protein
MTSNNKYPSQIEQIQKLVEASRKAFQLYETPFMKFIEDMEKNRRMVEQTLRPWKEIEELLSQMSVSPALLSINKMVKDLQSQWDTITYSIKEPILKINRAVEEWKGPIQLLQNNISLIVGTYSKEFELFRNLALSPSFYYGNFVRSTIGELELPRIRNITRKGLQASIESAGFEIDAENQLISQYPKRLFLEIVEQSAEDFLPPPMNLFRIQREDLFLMIRQHPEIMEDNDLLLNLPSSRLAYLARITCQKVVEINDAITIKGEEQIFKLTNRAVEALIALPMLVTIDRITFGEFVDHLYFIFYEAAGKDKLRILNLINNTEAQPIWDIKHLRNFVYRHDIEHGDQKGILKKYQTIAQLFQRLIGKSYPRSKEDFRLMQIKLVNNILSMLQLILKKID